MGSGSSHLRSRPPRTKARRFTKRSLSTLICGASASNASEMEEYPAESQVNCAEYRPLVPDKFQRPVKESISASSEGTGFTSRGTESAASSGSSNEDADEHVLSSPEASRQQLHFPEHLELASSHESRASTSCRGQKSSGNVCSNTDGISDVVASRGNILHQEEGVSSDGTVSGGHIEGVARFSSSDPVPSPLVPSSGVGSQSLGDDSIQEVLPSGLGFLMSDDTEGPAEASILHVDMVSISSGSLRGSNDELSTHEARRNSRRMFWDAFSTRSSRRHTDFSTILFATEDADTTGSQRRWLLDFGGDFFDGAEPWHLGRRNHIASGRRWHSRTQLLERLRSGAGESGRRTCPLGLHPDGSCLCDLDEEAGRRASISRIVMLAEALFEVLDEIHRQPTSFSLSMLSHPAPEAVVDSLPLKSFKKPDAVESGDDVEQCYICLAEYEDGDKIRSLPCHHEYHMSCVDKWLKEIHGVCPLCRGNVCEAGRQEPEMDPDASSLQSDHA